MDEHDLIERARNGDRRAERRLFDDHVDRIYRLAYRMTGRPSLAEECTQEAFVRAFDRLGQFREDAAFGTWLHSIAVSVVHTRMRREKRIGEREQSLEDGPTLSLDAPDPEPDLRRDLERAIDGLEEGRRTVFVMHEIEGYTHAEISDALGVAEGTSKARLSRARRELREHLSHHWSARDAAGCEGRG